jgi:peptide-methionine (S)-S-oxide reductase
MRCSTSGVPAVAGASLFSCSAADRPGIEEKKRQTPNTVQVKLRTVAGAFILLRNRTSYFRDSSLRRVIVIGHKVTLASALLFVWPTERFGFDAKLQIRKTDNQGDIMLFGKKSAQLPAAGDALAGRSEQMKISDKHFVTGNPLRPPFPENLEIAIFAMGCFWGAERLVWETPGVFSTAVGYTGGFTSNPTYEEVCSGRTGHTEAVLVVFNPAEVTYAELLKIFWEAHDPTQGMRQGNDIGTQYRSGIYVYDDEQLNAAEQSKALYESRLSEAGLGSITTEICRATDFYYAEDYHQQYLAKNPSGYCGIGGVGVKF